MLSPTSVTDPIPLPVDAKNNIVSKEKTNFESEALSCFLEYIENTSEEDTLTSFLSPTPIKPDGLYQIAEEVDISRNGWYYDRDVVQSIQSIFDKRKVEKESTFSPRKKLRACFSVVSESDIEEQPTQTRSSDFTNISDLFSNEAGYASADKWEQNFQDLVNFQKVRGHCLVPHKWKENPSLAHWVKRQRYQYKLKRDGLRTSMTDSREIALEQLGFLWEPRAIKWEELLNELRAYKKIFGTCNVPSTCTLYQRLAIWVKSQRRQYRNFVRGKPSNLSQERIGKLDDLGFIWNPKRISLSSK